MFDVNYPLMYFLLTSGAGLVVFLLSLCLHNKARKLLRILALLLILVSVVFWIRSERFEAQVNEKLQRGT
jgi:hypothetical protein